LIKLRQATVFDHSEILKLCVEWFNELTINGFPSVCEYSGIWLADLIANHIVFIGELEGKIIGAMVLRTGFMPWNNKEKVLINDAFMTDINYRDTGIGKLLIDVTKKFADDQDMMLILSHMTGKDATIKDRYFKSLGFKYAGGNLIYRRS